MIPPDKRPPKQRSLRIASFAMHATRGLLRDQTMRRKDDVLDGASWRS